MHGFLTKSNRKKVANPIQLGMDRLVICCPQIQFQVSVPDHVSVQRSTKIISVKQEKNFGTVKNR
jgi:hypothetical protein